MIWKPDDRVVKNPDTWQVSDFDQWGAGKGVGVVLKVVYQIDNKTCLDIRWPGGRCYQFAHELIRLEQDD